MTRRTFTAAASVTLQATQAAPGSKPKLGLDLFSLRTQGWDAFQYLDYAAKYGLENIHYSEIRFLGGLEEAHLKKVRERAEKHGISIEIGMRSICPTSKAFDPAQGTAEQQLTRMIHAAKIIGSPIVRCFLGTFADREKDSILRNVENSVKVLRAVRTKAMDAGIKIAVENHAGDMQARELKALVEAAGKEHVGVCLDSGNPVWALEDPHHTLETLAPYVLTSHVRDSALWRVPEGVAVRWTRMGDGNVDIAGYLQKYLRLCPGRPISLEIIVTGARTYNVYQEQFWEAYRQTPAWEFSRFLALADRGTPHAPQPPLAKSLALEREREDLETSIRWTKELLKV